MEYLLPAALILGAFLFILSWIMVIVFGFKHHPVTGIVAFVPGLNVLILPTIWHRVSGWVITGFVGLCIAAAAWGLGALDQISKHGFNLSSKVGIPAESIGLNQISTQAARPPQTPQINHVPLNLPAADTTQTNNTATTVPTPPQASTPPNPTPVATEPLPTAPLYKLGFETLPLNKLADYEGQYVQLIQTDGRKRAGRLIEIKDDELSLDERTAGQTPNTAIKLNSIRQAAVLVKQ
jgi:hypothetical protein